MNGFSRAQYSQMVVIGCVRVCSRYVWLYVVEWERERESEWYFAHRINSYIVVEIHRIIVGFGALSRSHSVASASHTYTHTWSLSLSSFMSRDRASHREKKICVDVEWFGENQDLSLVVSACIACVVSLLANLFQCCVRYRHSRIANIQCYIPYIYIYIHMLAEWIREPCIHTEA